MSLTPIQWVCLIATVIVAVTFGLGGSWFVSGMATASAAWMIIDGIGNYAGGK